MSLQGLLDEVGKLEVAISNARAGDPALGELQGRVAALQKQVDEARAMQKPLIPDSAGPHTAEDVTAEHLAQALLSLQHAIASKRQTT